MKSCLMAIVLLASTVPAWSADAPATGAAAEPSQEQIVANFRKDLEAKSADVMAKTLTLDADQATKFWPLYKEYQQELGPLVEGQLQATQDYVKNFSQLTDAQALTFIDGLLARDQKLHDLRAKWLKKFQTAVPGKTAARAIQIERRMGLVGQISISSQIPLVR